MECARASAGVPADRAGILLRKGPRYSGVAAPEYRLCVPSVVGNHKLARPLGSSCFDAYSGARGAPPAHYAMLLRSSNHATVPARVTNSTGLALLLLVSWVRELGAEYEVRRFWCRSAVVSRTQTQNR
jgi:hypothetical protein